MPLPQPPEPRVNANFPVRFSLERSECAGTLVNLSRSGALVAADRYVADVGAQLRLVISAPRPGPIAVDSCVVRRTANGFAVQFLGAPVELLELLADLGG